MNNKDMTILPNRKSISSPNVAIIATIDGEQEIIYQDEKVFINVERVADNAGIDLLKRTVYGTKGPRYQHTGQTLRSTQVHHPFYFRLSLLSGKTIGFYCLSKRLIETHSGQINSFYGRYFTVDENYKGNGYGHLLKKEAVRYVERLYPSSLLFYAYIEEHNVRSLRISEKEGFTSLAILETLLFSRLFPRLDKRFSRLQEDDKPALFGLLDGFYSKHTFKTFDNIAFQDNYFVLKEGDEIIAGAQANPVRWKIIDMPGIGGKFMLRILPHLPIMKKLINPNNHQFVALEGVYFREGHEEDLYLLLESILVHFNFNSALLQLDANDSLVNLLLESGKLGMLNSFKENINTHVMIKSYAVNQKQIKAYEDQPVYVSSFDFT